MICTYAICETIDLYLYSFSFLIPSTCHVLTILSYDFGKES